MILSRGGTADLLSRETDIPALDISISLGDILQAIKLAENYRAKFAIVGFPSITERARLICNLLNYTSACARYTAGYVPPAARKRLARARCF